VPRIQTRVTFCGILWHFTLLNFITILGFCHTVRTCLIFLAKPKMSHKTLISHIKHMFTNIVNPKPLRGSFQTFGRCPGFKATFRPDKPKNFHTSHVYVLGLESCLEWLYLLRSVTNERQWTITEHTGEISLIPILIKTGLSLHRILTSICIQFCHAVSSILGFWPWLDSPSLLQRSIYSWGLCGVVCGARALRARG